MNLEEIELFGFKTFVKTTKIILSNKITCIVGPNGSGKSNIVDAIRWVLGEGRLSILRASDSSDLIFSGSDIKNPLNVASVKLIFNNEDRAFPVATPKVIIERRVYREKESRFYLNGEESSLQSIISLFQSAGIYGYNFAIVGQGRVEEIVLAKPEEKKHIIDKIAGIDHFKRKKEEAVKRLNETEENLVRVFDRLSELKKEAQRIIEEAQKAHLYYLLSDKLKKLESDLLNSTLSKISKELSLLKGTLTDTEKEESKLLISLTEEKKKYEEINSNYKEFLEKLELFNSNKEEISVKKAKNSERENFLKEKIDTLNGKLSELRFRKESLERNESNLLLEIEEIEKRRQDIKLENENFEKVRNEIEESIAKIQEEIEPLIREENLLKAKIQEIQDNRVKKEKLIGILEAENNFLSTKKNELENQIEQLNALEKEDITDLQLQLKEQLKKKENIKKEIELLSENITLKKYKISELKKLPFVNNKALSYKENSLGSSLSINEYFPGIEEELNATIAFDISKISGDNGDHYFLEGEYDFQCPEELIPISKIYNINSKFLSNIFFVNSLKEAIIIFSKYYGKFPIKKIITGDGFVLLSPFEVKINTNITAIEKRKELERLESELAADFEKLQNMKNAENEAEQVLKSTQAKIFKANEVIEKISKTPALKKELEDTILKIKENETKINFLKVELKDLFIKGPELFDDKISDLRSRLDSEKQSLLQIESKIRENKVKDELFLKERNEKEKRIENIKKDIAEIQNSFELTSNEVSKLQEELKITINLLNSLSLDMKQIEEAIKSTKSSLKEISEKLKESELVIAKLSEVKEQIISKKEKMHISIAEHDVELRSILSEMEEKEIQQKELLYDVNIEKTKREIREVKDEISKLGPIDFTSLEKEESIRGELDEKEKVYEEVKTAKRELLRFISDTEKKMKEEFDKTLSGIEENFSKLFKKITISGDAEIEKIFDEDGEIKGIELSVRMPGKRKQPLPLLSGGEKALTAIAFLFSIFKVKKFPFYVLDEVDASLDDENVIRFGELLKEESQNAQFIIITHNKQTMEASEVLYGITMEEEGISKVVSLKLV